MYRIIKIDGTQLGVAESVLYIKISDNGSFVEAAPEDAVGVAFNSTPYNLLGHEDIEGAETVLVSEEDAGRIVETMATYSEMAAAIREGVNAV